MQASRVIKIQRSLFAVSFLMAFVTIASLPFALISVIKDIRHPDHEALEFTPSGIRPADNSSRLSVAVVSVDEVNHTASLRVNGFHSCTKDCGTYTDKVIFFQVDEDDGEQVSIPHSEGVTLPHTGREVAAKITLPIRGSVLTYPFDHYRLGLGVIIERTGADKTVRFLTPAETKGQLIITLDEQVARMEMANMHMLDPKSIMPKNAQFEYAYAGVLHFERPAFLKIVVSFVVLLTVAVAIYTMITRPFDQLVINAGAVILGVFGARSLVLSGFPADVTLVDTIFSMVVLYNLLALTIRGMNFFHRGGKLNILPWARPEPEQPADPKADLRDCPACLSKVPAAAKRCAFCTSELPPPETTQTATIRA